MRHVDIIFPGHHGPTCSNDSCPLIKPKKLKCGHPKALIFDAKPGTGSWYCEYCFRFENDMRHGFRVRELEDQIQVLNTEIDRLRDLASRW